MQNRQKRPAPIDNKIWFFYNDLTMESIVEYCAREGIPQIKRRNFSVERPEGENKMGIMPVNRLLLNMSIPIMISMLVQAFTTW